MQVYEPLVAYTYFFDSYLKYTSVNKAKNKQLSVGAENVKMEEQKKGHLMK